jgi:hypothetical protein
VEIVVTVIGVLLAGLIIVSALFHGTRPAAGDTSAWARDGHVRSTRLLWALVIVGIVASVLLRSLHTLTGIRSVDGWFGVALGLYLCAHPAANAVNLLFFQRELLGHLSEWSMVRWLALNLLLLLAGWMVVFSGLTRLLGRASG